MGKNNKMGFRTYSADIEDRFVMAEKMLTSSGDKWIRLQGLAKSKRDEAVKNLQNMEQSGITS
jgi:hypothetical protein